MMQKMFSNYNVDVLLIDDSSAIFYLTGCSVCSAMVLIFPENIILFVDERYFEEVVKKNRHQTDLLSDEHVKQALHGHGKRHYKIGVDASKMSVSSFQKHQQKFANLEKGITCELVALDRPLKEVRMIKFPNEIERMRKAAQITWKGFLHARSLLKEGVTEKEISLAFELFCRKEGASKVSFDPIIAFGKNAAIPHHSSDDTPLDNGEIVLMDLGVVYKGYCSDMTRTFFFGPKDKELEKIYKIVLETQKKVLTYCRPGMPIGKLDEIARAFFQEKGVQELYLHSLGHGVGIDVHEYPRLRFDNEEKKLLLQEGMIITIEPGLYIANTGGVRYEDTILITQDGYENFYPGQKDFSL